MTKRLVVFLCLMALAPFALAACGDDDDGGDESAATTTEETTDTGGDTGGGGGTVDISADPSGEIAYEQDSVSAPAGTVTIAFTNDSDVPHDVKVEGPDGGLTHT